MNGLLIGILIALTILTLASLVAVMFLVWWTMGSSGQHSISAGRREEAAMSMAQGMVSQISSVVKVQATLTELLLLGRPAPPTDGQQLTTKPSETSPTPDAVWETLPDNIKEAYAREAEEEATWPSPSEQLQNPSESDGWVPFVEPTSTTTASPSPPT